MIALKRTLLILAPLIITTGLFAGALKYFDPEIQTFILNQVQKQSSLHSPFEIQAEEFHYSFFPPEVSLHGLQIAPKNNLGIENFEIESLHANLDILQLFGGRLMVAELLIDNPSLQLDLDALPQQEKTENTKIELTPLFRLLKILPLSQIHIQDLEAEINSAKKELHLETNHSSMTFVNRGDALSAELDLYAHQAKFRKWEDDLLLNASLSLSAKNLELHLLKLNAFATQIELSADLSDLPQALLEPKISGHLKLQTDLALLKEKIEAVTKLPTLTGQIKTQIDFKMKGLDWPNANIDFRSTGLTASGFDIGNIDFNGEFRNKKLISNTVQITNEASTVNLNQLELTIDEKQNAPLVTFKSKVDTEMLDLNELLKRLQVGDIPLELITAGHFDCQGLAYPQFAIDCHGHAEGESLEVRTSNETTNNILAIENFQAQGDVKIDLDRVWYKGAASIGTSHGQSEGTIRYDSGFDITYSSDETNLRDLGQLGGLKLEGKAKLSGRTWGDSNQGQFIINVDGQDLWFEDYLLGHAKGSIRYSNGKLYFDNIQSTIGSSRYQGTVIANLLNDHLELEMQAKQFELSDVTKAFSRKVQLPLDFTGSADIDITANGPYDFSHLSYQLKTTIQHATIANEGFDLIQAEIDSENGNVTSKQFQMNKGKGTITGTGAANPNGQIDVKLEGHNLLLEESENIAKLGVSIAGLAQANLQLKGHILNPEISLVTDVGVMTIDDQEFQPSYANVKINRNTVSGNVNLFKNKLTSDFIFPLNAEAPFKLQASARDWNYTSLFAFIGGGFLLGDYKASMTGDLDLRADHGGIFHSSGKGSIEKLLIRRGNIEMSSPGPMDMSMNRGALSLKNFRISNEDSYLELSSQNTTAERLAIQSRGKVSLRILQIFLPFMEELNGLGTFQMQIGGPLEKPEIYGNAKIQDGFVKLKAFPHPFEKIESTIQFSQSRILISKLDSSLAGGTLNGEGVIRIEGLKNFPVSIKGKLEGATFLVPERFRTSGSADVGITGSWFPFTIAATYHIQSGYIDKEFSSDTLGSAVKQSSYLPKVILQTAFDPIDLNIQTLIEKPLTIRNSLFDGQITGGVLIKGTPDQPSLSGKLNIEKNSHLVFNNTPFDISTGTVTFTSAKEINPEIYIAGRSRVMDYEINLLAQGTGKNPLVHMTSQPPLPENDIISLLAFGVTSSTLDKNSISSQKNDSNQNMQNLISSYLARTASKKTEKYSVQFQTSSQYDDTKNISVQKYSVGVQVTNKFSISATKQKADISSDEYKLKYSFNPNVSATATYENRENTQTSSTSESQRQGSVLGFDLEYKMEFK